MPIDSIRYATHPERSLTMYLRMLTRLNCFSWRKKAKRRRALRGRRGGFLTAEALEQRQLLAAAPVALPESYSVLQGGELIVDAGGVLSNDTDADQDPLTAVLVSDVQNGSLEFNADGSFVYTPDPDFRGVDTFRYRAVALNPTQVFNVIQAESSVDVDVTLQTAVGTDDDSDSSTMTGTLGVRVIPTSEPFQEIQITAMDVVVADGIDLNFSFRVLFVQVGALDVVLPPNPSGDPTLAPLRLSMQEPGAPSAVDQGAFAQTDNTFGISGIAYLDASGLVADAVMDGPILLDTGSLPGEISGQVTQNGDEVTVSAPLAFSGVFPLDESNSADLDFSGLLVARGPLATVPEQSNEVTVTIEVLGAPPRVANVEINAGIADPDDTPTGEQPARWATQRSDIRRLTVMFSEEMDLAPQDLRLTNLGVNMDLDPDANIALRADQMSVDGREVRIDFAAGELSDGVYELEVLGTATDLLGNPLDGDGDGSSGDSFVLTGSAENNFYKLTADWNADQGTSIFDFPTFSYWFGRPEVPDYVDLNEDGGATIFDFPLFAANFGRSLVFSTPLEGGTAGDATDAAPADTTLAGGILLGAARNAQAIQHGESRRGGQTTAQRKPRSAEACAEAFPVWRAAETGRTFLTSEWPREQQDGMRQRSLELSPELGSLLPPIRAWETI